MIDWLIDWIWLISFFTLSVSPHRREPYTTKMRKMDFISSYLHIHRIITRFRICRRPCYMYLAQLPPDEVRTWIVLLRYHLYSHRESTAVVCRWRRQKDDRRCRRLNRPPRWIGCHLLARLASPRRNTKTKSSRSSILAAQPTKLLLMSPSIFRHCMNFLWTNLNNFSFYFIG